jgi:fructose-1-phosphate kinase PfkB-like protein
VAVVSADERAFLTAPEVTVANPIGAGDSLVGGVATALDAGASLLEAARLGVAAASASVTSRVPADVDGALARRLTAQVRRLL